MTRRVYLFGVGVVLVALALAFTDWALGLQPGITEANVKRIRPGMPLVEVNALMGEPGRRYPCLDPKSAAYFWDRCRGRAYVLVGRDERVQSAHWTPPQMTAVEPFFRLRAWLGW